MNRKNHNELYFLWRENFITYFWASNVTAWSYFIDSGVLFFQNGVLSAYATSDEIKKVKKNSNSVLNQASDVVEIDKKFSEIREDIKKIRSLYLVSRIRKYSDKELYHMMIVILKIFRKYVSFYNLTEAHRIEHIEKRALDIIGGKCGKSSPEEALANVLGKKNISKNKIVDLSNEEIDVLVLIKKIAKVRFKAKTIDEPLAVYAERLAAEIAKRKNLALNQVDNLTITQLKNLLLYNKEPRMIDVNKRYHFFGLKINKKKKYKVRDLTAKEFNKILELTYKEANNKEIYGFVGYPGNVRGTARIMPRLFKDKEFREYVNSLKKTDVLISPMTSPKITLGFSRVAAVITDEGGLMSHAALIAREKKVPCVIGTKIATIVFKEGDLLQVDANKGVITKLGK